mmetsp:Transcript_5946/g.13210  ORF Transcript_5946/g.13210 Transcript_5946/m.13210 type:complete len:106 (-) Transcript_5946:567-884(-)
MMNAFQSHWLSWNRNLIPTISRTSQRCSIYNTSSLSKNNLSTVFPITHHTKTSAVVSIIYQSTHHHSSSTHSKPPQQHPPPHSHPAYPPHPKAPASPSDASHTSP